MAQAHRLKHEAMATRVSHFLYLGSGGLEVDERDVVLAVGGVGLQRAPFGQEGCSRAQRCEGRRKALCGIDGTWRLHLNAEGLSHSAKPLHRIEGEHLLLSTCAEEIGLVDAHSSRKTIVKTDVEISERV